MEFFYGRKEYDHRQTSPGEGRIGVLLANLGTPDAPTAAALKPYLKVFLSDPRVIELPRLKWKIILNLFILPFRPKASAELYRRIWTEKGSPLLVFSELQKKALQEYLNEVSPDKFVVEIGMRIGNPGIEPALKNLEKAGATRLLVLPMFPQYSGTTTGSTFDGLAEVFKTWRWIPEFRMITSYHDEAGYIAALVQSIKEHWAKKGKAEKLLFSFHGLPKRYFENGDPYQCYCQKTARLVVESLGLKKEEYLVSFQSLFGKEEWLRPYTEETLKSLGAAGLSSIDVICPGFAADCLETLEEIEEQNKEFFLHAGGKDFRYIPALNDHPAHISFLADLVKRHTQGWEVATLQVEAKGACPHSSRNIA